MKRGLHSVLKAAGRSGNHPAGGSRCSRAPSAARPDQRLRPVLSSRLVIEARNSMLMGHSYPHWTSASNFGAASRASSSTRPLTWMTGAALGLVSTWGMVGSVFGFLLLAAIGLATRKLAREVLEDGPATLAGCAAIFSGYPLLTFYVRADFAELAGGFWIPLMLLFLLRDRNSSRVFGNVPSTAPPRCWPSPLRVYGSPRSGRIDGELPADRRRGNDCRC